MFKKNFKSRLFINLSTIIIAITCIFVAFFYIFNIKKITDNEIANSKSIATDLSTKIDSLYNSLDTTLNYLTNSPELQNLVSQLNSGNVGEYLDYQKIQNDIQKSLSTVLFLPSIHNILLYNKNEKYIYYSGFSLSDTVLEKKLYESANYKNNTNTTFLPPYAMTDDSKVISVYKNIRNNKDTFIEVQAPYSELEKICDGNLLDGKKVILFDKNYNLIYPSYKKNSKIESYFINQIKLDLKNKNLEKEKNIYNYQSIKSDYTNLHVVLISNKEFLLKQKFSFLCFSILIILLVSTVFLVGIFITTKRLTAPLTNLISNIESTKNYYDSLELIKNHDFDEFSVISESFNTITKKLDESLNLIYQSKLNEVNANYIALQAQINPHFIYNTLSSISAASELYGSDVTTQMCQNLALMLRYTTSSENVSTLEKEINHVNNYLKLMKISNMGQFSYSINMNPELSEFKIPKLILQPIIENSFKYGFNQTLPPWNIDISILLSNNKIKITVIDNGFGFLKEDILELNSFISNLSIPNNLVNHYENLSMNGLGLKNIFSRLSIFYKNNLDIIVCNNNNNKGAKIIIEVMIFDD